MNANEIWQATLERLKPETSHTIFTIWFEGTTGLSFEDDVLTVLVTSPFAKTQLERRFDEQICTIASEIAGTTVQFQAITKYEWSGYGTSKLDVSHGSTSRLKSNCCCHHHDKSSI